MDYSRPELADRLAAEYVLGTLRGPARRRFEALVPAHPALSRAMLDWQRRVDALSVSVPCSDPTRRTHVMFLPITFKYYMSISNTLPMPESVVCIGCDSHYGPNRKMLETAFVRPYTLYLEYPSEYVHNTPFKKMNGEAAGEEMTFIRKFQPKTNETQYTKRVMKIIQYSKV